jgi:hypothetical protein
MPLALAIPAALRYLAQALPVSAAAASEDPHARQWPSERARPRYNAQASLWKDGVALEGPDTDALKGSWREAGGTGVHFSGPGLREHAAR